MNPNSTLNEIQEILKSVSDPEIPVLTIEDLGIIKEIEIEDKVYLILTI